MDQRPLLEASRDVDLDAYLPRWVSEQSSAASTESAGSQVRPVSAAVLLVDIVGFKALTEKLTQVGPRGAETLRGVLNRYFGAVSSLVSAHGGDTATFAGDALLAFWAVGSDGERAACLAAARCALAIRDAVSRLAPELPAPIRQRLAIDFGPLSLLEIAAGSSRRFALLAGAPLYTIASTCRAATPETVRVGRAAWQLIQGHCTASSLHGDEAVIELVAAEPAARLTPASPLRLSSRQLSSYLPRSLVERLRAGQGEWLAEFRTLSIVFINFGAMDTSTADLPARLEAGLAAALVVEAKTGGAIYQFLMDDKGINLILAYGLPHYHQEDDAARAVEAALVLSDSLQKLGFSPAIGVATGQSFCGTCGQQRRQYSIIGSPINRSARLMQDASGAVLFDDATVNATTAHFEFERNGVVFKHPQRRTTSGTRLNAGAIVGRERELQSLVERLTQLQAGQGGLVLVEGDAGVGKSRLIDQLCVESEERGVSVLHGAATSLEQGTPYYFWREPLRQLLGGAAGAEPLELGQRLLAKLAGSALLEHAPLLADVLPLQLPPTEQSPVQPSGVARVAALHDVLSLLLEQASTQRPTLFVLHDLHWLDPSSLEALTTVAQRVPTLLLLGTSRPHAGTPTPAQAGLARQAQQALRLDALPRAALGQLMAQRLGSAAVPEALLDFAFERTLGHPLFCEELLLSLRDAGAISVTEGVCEVSEQALDRAITKIPATLQGVIISRVDRLPTAEQLAVKVAGVIGRRFSPRMLREIYPTSIEPSELLAVLKRLVDSDLLHAFGSRDDPHYGFRHVIAQESVAELVLFAQRRELHERVALWVESNHAQSLDPHVAELALHWELAEQIPKAVGYLERAGKMALQRYANSEAVKALRRAFELCDVNGHTPSSEQRAHWEAILGQAWHELSDSGRSSEHFTRALSLSGHRVAHSAPAVAWGVARQLFIQLCRRVGIWRPGLDASRAEAAHMFALLGEHWYFENDSFRVLYATLCSLNHAEASSSRRVVDGFGAMAVGLGIAGMDRLALYYLQHATSRAERLGNPADVAYAQLLAGVYAAGKADWQPMTAALERASGIYRQLGDPFRWQQSRSILCFGALIRGDSALAEALLSEINAASSRVGFVQVRAWTWSARTALALASGRGMSQQIADFAGIPTSSLPVSERLLCTGLLAEAQFRTGASVDALASANAALASLLQSPPTAWHLVPGVSGIAETYLGLLEHTDVASAQRRVLAMKARLTCRAVRKFSGPSRAARPLALRLQARLESLEGKAELAARLASESLQVAQRLSLARDEQLAQLELARLGRSSEHQLESPRGLKEHDG